jgi:hypothetical protein
VGDLQLQRENHAREVAALEGELSRLQSDMRALIEERKADLEQMRRLKEAEARSYAEGLAAHERVRKLKNVAYR